MLVRLARAEKHRSGAGLDGLDPPMSAHLPEKAYHPTFLRRGRMPVMRRSRIDPFGSGFKRMAVLDLVAFDG